MTRSSIGRCGGCGVIDKDCDGCATCLPMSLCALVTVTPGPYREFLADCCSSFGIRLPYRCGYYAGSGQCPEGVGTTVTITIEKVYGECRTVVSSPLLAYDLIYEGVYLTPSFSGVTSDGDRLDVVVSCDTGVENPIAKEPCSPCVCARCLPRQLCCFVSTRLQHDESCGYTLPPAGGVGIVATWDCETRGWIVPTTEITLRDCTHTVSVAMTITMMPASSGVCAMHVVGSLTALDDPGTGYIDEVLLLDLGPDPSVITGSFCASNEATTFTLGTPKSSGTPGTEQYISVIDTVLQFVPHDAYDPTPSGFVRITSDSCGVCSVCSDSNTIAVPCCGDVQLPSTLHIEVNGVPISGTYGNVDPASPSGTAGWGGTGVVCGYDASVAVWCEPGVGGAPNRWQCKITWGDDCAGGLSAPYNLPSFGIVTAVCDPFSLTFTHQSPVLNCPPVPVVHCGIDVTVTA